MRIHEDYEAQCYISKKHFSKRFIVKCSSTTNIVREYNMSVKETRGEIFGNNPCVFSYIKYRSFFFLNLKRTTHFILYTLLVEKRNKLAIHCEEANRMFDFLRIVPGGVVVRFSTKHAY